jgi:formimidoylglutamate deiminase
MMPVFYKPDLLYIDDAFRAGAGLLVDDAGMIQAIVDASMVDGVKVVQLPGRALLPGLVNGHSHSFQRLIRGVAEHSGPNGDDFWAWRNTMYHAASSLSPDELYDVARMTFLEMALSGITAVGEFHYVHRQPDGTAYPDPNQLAKRVIDAARSVGLRICLLRVAYERAGFNLPPNSGQRRFYESSDEYIDAAGRLREDLDTSADPAVTMGIAPHSIRALPLTSLKRAAAFSAEHNLPLHIHMAEQTAELTACEREYGVSPVRLLGQHNLLSDRLTLVHAIHTSPDEVSMLANADSMICSCPTTERNLGDGVIDAQSVIGQGISISFGSDSQATINLLEDARELDYHLRLVRQRRVLLDGIDGVEMSTRLFRYATAGGARSLGLPTGKLTVGTPADFFTVDLADVSIAGASPQELLPTIVFSLERAAVREVAVGGSVIVDSGRHPDQSGIVDRYAAVARRLASVPR